MEPAAILAAFIVALIVVAFVMVQGWARRWETRLAAQDRRLEITDRRLAEHDQLHALTGANVEYIRDKIEVITEAVLDGRINGKAG